ncbi:hypothetical protein A9264_13355 [Vibrio sp. UCD-FRSSP16_10]|uniref:hypothetical protein n=1 Tax=unclassified Vibrio TaxID=2614977 RepID=UPI0007FD140D|nr:hypothetical protein A9260_13570 [Vibrio sp. UCD-FRSSP16_30]OBT20102.1 hypothetical protein A9264_13355 [Vibrio sp. UCD-FRSSP16_10]
MKRCLALLFLSTLVGCTHNQAKNLDMNTSSVNVYPQKMTNLQLCDTLYYGRHTNQTHAAIGSEFNRRKLYKTWCQRHEDEFYLTRSIKWVVHTGKGKKTTITKEISYN